MQPLAERMRPSTLKHYIGQEHLVGDRAILQKAIQNNTLPSIILWGPPGVGKTTLAYIIANELKRPFFALSAINSGVKDIRDTIEKAQRNQFFNQPNPILFIDEIHRFSKSQQDSLLGAVERGIITLIGATTENPSFEVISALLSRCQVYILKPLSVEHLKQLITQAIEEDEHYKSRNISIKDYEALIKFSGGDGRKLLNTLEIVISQYGEQETIIIDNEQVTNAIQSNMALYDKSGEQHYDIISAFIKSIRGSDPNAAVYYLARMLKGGEDPKFICRRMIISASEDIGLANPNALLIANACAQSVQNIGLPEGRIVLSQAAIYLATSPKSNSAYMAIKKAESLVNETGNLSIPLSLRNAPTKLMKDLGYGSEYQYAHDFDQNFVHHEFLPDEIAGTKLYDSGNNGAEQKIAEKLKLLWKDKYGY